jgi:hypothetical protein
MKPNLMILMGIMLCVGACAPTVVQTPPPPPPSATVAVEVGDQPYYVHGPYYVAGGRRWVWIGGHWAIRNHHRVWIHGHYVVR